MTPLTRGLRALALVLLVLGLTPVGTGPAAAHAALVSSDPRDGARLERLPDRVSLTFTEEVATPAYVVVRASDGRQLASGNPEVEGATVSQALGAADDGGGETAEDTGEVSGEVTVAYRIVSTDGHPVTGELTFAVASSSTADPSSGRSAEPSAHDDAAASADSSATDADAEAAAAPSEPEGSWATHGSHYLLGGFLVVVAGVLLWLARGRASP